MCKCITIILLIMAVCISAANADIFTTVEKNNISALQKYLDNKGNVNVTDANGATLLHHAVAIGNRKIVSILLKHNANVNAAKKDGVAPLHIAVALRQIEIIKLLIASGADINLPDLKGRTPLSMAAGNDTVIKLLNQSKQQKISSSTNPVKQQIDTNAIKGEAAPPDSIWLDSLDLNYMTAGFGKPLSCRSIEEHPIRVGGVTYPHGVGTHANSNFTVQLAGAATRFIAMVGVDNEMTATGTIIFHVFVDGKQIVQTPVLKAGGLSQLLDVDLTGAKFMALSVDDAGDGGRYDHADWAGGLIYMQPESKIKPCAICPIQSNWFSDNFDSTDESLRGVSFFDLPDVAGSTLLHKAVAENRIDVIKKLLEYGANVNAARKDGVTPLHLSVALGYTEAVKQLIKMGASQGVFNINGHIPADYIVASAPQSDENLARKAKITATSEEGNQWAARYVADGVIPNPNSKTDVGHAWAVDKSSNADAGLNFEWTKDVTVSQIVYYGRTALSLSDCWSGYDVFINDEKTPAASGKLEAGHGPQCISVPTRHDVHKLQIHFAGWYGGENPGASEIQIFSKQPETAASLVGLPAGANGEFLKAAATGDMQVINNFLVNGGDINTTDASGATALHYAIAGDKPDVVKFLLSHNANANAQRIDGANPLHVAAYHQRYNVAPLLIAAGANMDALDARGRTPFAASQDVDQWSGDDFPVGAARVFNASAPIAIKDPPSENPIVTPWTEPYDSKLDKYISSSIILSPDNPISSEWPQWRGPLRNGLATQTPPLADHWGAAGPAKLWEMHDIKVAPIQYGGGASSPVIANGKVYIYAHDRGGHRDAFVCIDAATGKVVWKREYPIRMIMHGASSTPCVVGNRVYFNGARGAYCMDASNGKLIWRFDSGRPGVCRWQGWEENNSSFAVIGDVAMMMNGPTYALDALNGSMKWKAPEIGGWAGGMSSPVFWSTDNHTFTIFSGWWYIYCIEPQTGQIIWCEKVNRSGGECQAPTPAICGNIMVTSSGGDLCAYQLTPKGPHLVWHSPYPELFSCPVIYSNCVYTVAKFNSGVLRCQDLFTGKVIWDCPVPNPESSSPLIADGKVILFAEKGKKLQMYSTGQTGQLLAEADINSLIWTSPSFSNGCLYIRTPDGVTCYDLTKAANEK